MNPFFSVRFRLFALCLSLLAIMGGANILLGNIIREREPQELEQQAQIARVEAIHTTRHAINTYRHDRSLLDTARVVRNQDLEAKARIDLARAEAEVERHLAEVSEFDPGCVSVIREALREFPGEVELAVEAINAGSLEEANLHFGEVNRWLYAIEDSLDAAVRREQERAQNLQGIMRERAEAAISMAAWIILLSTTLGLLITWAVLRSIIRPLRTTVTALRQVNAGETFMDLPPISRDEFGDMAVALRQFRDQAERLRHLAFNDPLTGLGNRASLDQALQAGIESSRRESQRLALLYIDLDNFSGVNDSLGHSAGDRYLCEAADRLQRFVPMDATVCRYSGDKFTVLVEGLEGGGGLKDRLQAICEDILRGMSEPFPFGGHQLPMSVTIGVSVYPSDGETGEQLLSSADAAMYASKRAGRNSFRFARPELMADTRAQLDIATEMRRGIELREFEPYYQPIVDVVGGKVHSAEALLRWRHPSQGLLQASKFIPVAETTGLIHALGERCLIDVSKQIGAWARDNRRIRVAVNLSARQIENQSVIALLERLHAESDVRVDCLDFEITESAMLEQIEQARETLNRVKELGYRLSLDDFGTGYSSLAYLQRLPLDKIKIDRSFVVKMDTSKEARAIVAATLALGQSLNLEVIAEGVETAAQMNQLRGLGCYLQQGFYFTPALSASNFVAWWTDYDSRHPAKEPGPAATA